MHVRAYVCMYACMYVCMYAQLLGAQVYKRVRQHKLQTLIGRSHSSVASSARLITARSAVQARVGPFVATLWHKKMKAAPTCAQAGAWQRHSTHNCSWLEGEAATPKLGVRASQGACFGGNTPSRDRAGDLQHVRPTIRKQISLDMRMLFQRFQSALVRQHEQYPHEGMLKIKPQPCA